MEREEVEAIVKKHRGILSRISEELGIGVTTVRAVLVTQERPGPHVWEAFEKVLLEIKSGKYIKVKNNAGEIVWTDEKVSVYNDLINNNLSEYEAKRIVRYLNEAVVYGYANALNKSMKTDWESIARGEVAPLEEVTVIPMAKEAAKELLYQMQQDLDAISNDYENLKQANEKLWHKTKRQDSEIIELNERLDKLENRSFFARLFNL